jgi:CHAT domain-containing protein
MIEGKNLNGQRRTRYCMAHARGKRELQRTLSWVLPSIGEKLMRPLTAHLQHRRCASATLVPTWYLQSLPLHAAPCDEQNDGLSDIMPVSYLPAAVFGLKREESSTRRMIERQFVGVASSDSTLPALYGADREVRFAWSAYPGSATAVFGSAATREFVLESMKKASNLHLGCHASINGDVWGAQLHLNDGYVTSEDLLKLPRNPNLGFVVAAACESGHHETSLSPDEAVGLGVCFLDRGASVVVTSLWAVDDRATGLLMKKFYEVHSDRKVSVAEALRISTHWLRNASHRDVLTAESIQRRMIAGAGKSRTLREARRVVRSNTPKLRRSQHSRRSRGRKIVESIERRAATDTARLPWEARRRARSNIRKIRSRQFSRPYSHPYFWAGWTATGSLDF